MGTRSSIHFSQSGKPVATVYRHWDSSPKTMVADLATFFDAVEKQCGGDTRFGDPSYLAAKFVVWQAGRYAREPSSPLAFLGVGILGAGEVTGDAEYVYDVACNDSDARPVVTHRRL